MAAVLGAVLLPGRAEAAVDCGALMPSSVAAQNLQNLNSCLSGVDGRAVLTPGTYNVDGSIVVPLRCQPGGDTTYPAIRLSANPSGAVRLVRFHRIRGPFGSNVGSRWGGGDRFTAETACTSAASPDPCNVDDYQHPVSVNWARNDSFYFY